MRVWPCAARCRTPDAAPAASVATTESTSSRRGTRATQTTAVPEATSGARYDWSSPDGTRIRPSMRRAANAATSARSRPGSPSTLAASTTSPRAAAASCTARRTVAENGSATSSSSRPIDAVRASARRRTRAPTFGRKPSSSTARRTRSVSAGDTPGSSFTTRDTVLKLTPARAATSRRVGRLPSPIVGSSLHRCRSRMVVVTGKPVKGHDRCRTVIPPARSPSCKRL